MIKKLLIGMTAVSWAAVGSAPTAAAIMTLTYTGTVDSGVDAEGVFGPEGSQLSGLSYVQVFRYDTSVMTKNIYPGYEGFSIEAPGPEAGFGSLTINGITRTIGDTISDLDQGSIELIGVYNFATFFSTQKGYSFDYMGTSQTENLPTHIDHNAFGPLSRYDPNGFGTGGYWVSTDDENERRSTIILNPTSFTLTGGISDLSNVPEPTSWALMIAGFGLTGVAVRRRHVVLAV